jgi:ribonuclease D
MSNSGLSLPSVPQGLIADSSALAEVCEHLRGAGRFAFDTEFIGESTYEPILCLIQVATEERVEMIDPLAIPREEMLPFWELLADEKFEKICHAGDQDVEIAWLESGLVPRNMFDTQLGAGMLGISYPTALWRAVEHFTGVTLEKGHTYSMWNRRPLSKEQFTYAVDDVRYLPLIHREMVRALKDRGPHLAWMRDACQEMITENAGAVDARAIYQRVKGSSGMSSQQLAVLREIASLREQIAFEHDLPPRFFMKDDALGEIGARMPRTVQDLGRIKEISPEDLATYGETIVELVKKAIALPESARPRVTVSTEDSAEEKRQGETLWVAAQVICLGQSVTPALVTSQSEIMSLARLMHDEKPIEGHPLMRGWHRDCLGEKLVAFIRGELEVDLTMLQGQLTAAFRKG